MKRFLSYLFTYFLVTFFMAVVVACAWFVINGANMGGSYATVNAQILDAHNPEIVVDTPRGTEGFRVQTVQMIRCKYIFEGKEYISTRDIKYDEEFYTSQPNTSAMTPIPKYKANTNLTIYVKVDDPFYFYDGINTDSENVSVKKIVLYVLPVYVLVLILFTVSFAKKEKRHKKEKFYREMEMMYKHQ